MEYDLFLLLLWTVLTGCIASLAQQFFHFISVCYRR